MSCWLPITDALFSALRFTGNRETGWLRAGRQAVRGALQELGRLRLQLALPWQACTRYLHIWRARRAVTRTTEGAVCQQVPPGLPPTGSGLSRRVALQPDPRAVHGASRLRRPLVRPAWLHQEQGVINDSHVRGYAFCICRLKLWFIIFELPFKGNVQIHKYTSMSREGEIILISARESTI